MPNSPISILVVEDSESDFDLLSLRLAHQGFPVELERVETERDMRAALAARHWDLVISDHKLPRFSLSGALRVLHEHDPEIPRKQSSEIFEAFCIVELGRPPQAAASAPMGSASRPAAPQ